MFSIFKKQKAAKSLPLPAKKPFVCSTCHKGFPNKGALAGHLKFYPLHASRPTLARPEQCQECHRTFPDQLHLSLHVVAEHSAWIKPTSTLAITYEPAGEAKSTTPLAITCESKAGTSVTLGREDDNSSPSNANGNHTRDTFCTNANTQD